jgi:hypothetical protein
MKILSCLLILLLLVSTALWAADDNETKYITVIPGKQYKAGWLHKLFLGAHWRHLWTTPVRVEVLDLKRFSNGLTPVKRGGGKQTKSLRFKGNDGNFWKFRSISKDPGQLLPKEFQDTLVEWAFKDQVSSANPMAPLVVAPIMKAVGILQAEPQLVWMPDDEGLGRYREEFAKMLGTIEIHPKVDKDDQVEFAGAEKIINTFKLLNRLEKKRDERFDSKEYLKTRLVDIFVGDWDRHFDQWLWALYQEGDREYWRPIPRDRDQAFSKSDGLLPWLSTYMIMELGGFGSRYPWIRKISWSGRFVDRRYLTEMDKTTWDSITTFVKDRLTDQVIREAVKRLPPEHYKKAGEKLIKILKARRDRLPGISFKYFKQMNKVIDVYASAKDDFVQIDRLCDDETVVAVFKRDKKTEAKKGEPLYYKKVDHRFTSEIRIYLSDGDDRAELKGVVNSGPLVRVIGGKGKDQLIDNSLVKGFFLKITPFKKAETKTIFYDSGKKTFFKKARGTKIVREKVPEPANDEEKFRPLQRDRSSQFFILPVISYSSHDGLIIGANPSHYKYNFRAKPYERFLSLNASYATKTGGHHVHFQGIFNSIIKGTSVSLDILKTQFLFTDYFGYGNETGFDKTLEKERYYETREDFLIFHPSLQFKLGKKAKAAIGVAYSFSDIALENESLLEEFTHNRYGLGSFQMVELVSSLQYDTRDHQANPYQGIFLDLVCSYAPKLLDNRFDFFKSEIDARLFFTLKILTPMTFAFHMGGAKTWGDYPFFRGAFLGGNDNLRGYNRNRFAGDACLFGQAEIRAYLGSLKLVLPARIGFHLFTEAGRVFKKDENSNQWHPAYGGGIWISFANRFINTSFTIARSPEKFVVYFNLGFMY